MPRSGRRGLRVPDHATQWDPPTNPPPAPPLEERIKIRFPPGASGIELKSGMRRGNRHLGYRLVPDDPRPEEAGFPVLSVVPPIGFPVDCVLPALSGTPGLQIIWALLDTDRPLTQNFRCRGRSRAPV